MDQTLKKEIYVAFNQDEGRIYDILSCLKLENLNLLRQFMEESISDLEDLIIVPLGPFEEGIHNAKMKEWELRNHCYSKVMDLILQELDGKTNRVHTESSL